MILSARALVTTAMSFVSRGVNLLGVDAVSNDVSQRAPIRKRLCSGVPLGHLKEIERMIRVRGVAERIPGFPGREVAWPACGQD